jgi:hypothetical protein
MSPPFRAGAFIKCARRKGLTGAETIAATDVNPL